MRSQSRRTRSGRWRSEPSALMPPAVRSAIGVHGFPLPTVGEVGQSDLDAVAAAGLEVLSLYMTPEERAQPGLWADTLREQDRDCGPPSVLARRFRRQASRARRVRAPPRGRGGRGGSCSGRCGGRGAPLRPAGWIQSRGTVVVPPGELLTCFPAGVRTLAARARAAAEAGGVGIVFEGFQSSVVESTAVMRELIEEAGSPAVGANLDYVNFLTPPAVARWPEELLRMADDLGPTMVSIHVKDCIVEPRLSCHVDERPAGSGDLDLAPVIELGRRTGVPLLVEHLNEKTAEAAIRTLVQLAQ